MHNNKNYQSILEQADDNLVYGKNAVLELLKSERSVDVIYLDGDDDDRSLRHLVALAKDRDAVIKRVNRAKLDSLCHDRRHQGVAVYASGIEYKSLVDILRIAHEKREDLFLLIADGIEDPHNLGAIIRTAEAAGVHGLVVAKRGSVGITTTVQRASAGAVNHLPIARVANLASTVRELKELNVFCYCADMDGQYVYNTELTGPVALVIGSEGQGVSRLLRELCDIAVSLPMRGKITSLNASVAAGAMLYEIVRQRNTNDKQGGAK